MTGLPALPRRWPVHPEPEPLESLSSWLNRLADVYQMTVVDLLRQGLGIRVAQPGSIDDDLDRDPPAGLLDGLTERTGVPAGDLRAMSVAGWEPLLLQTWAGGRERTRQQLAWSQAAFGAYVRDSSVLLAPGEAGSHVPYRRARSWWGPWQTDELLNRRCSTCWTKAHPVSLLAWQLPMLSSCCDGCPLLDPVSIVVERLGGGSPASDKVSRPLVRLDQYTYEGLSTGRVQLPGRTVHVAVWLRIVRALLDEVSLSATTITKAGHTTIARVWEAAGHPYRAGLSVWRPYEHLHLDIRAAMLEAAAAAVMLAADGTIRPRGIYGPALREQRHRPVPSGDRPSPWAVAWQEASAQLADLLTQARTDRAAAHRVLGFITAGSRSAAIVQREIDWMVAARVPTRFFDDYPLPEPMPEPVSEAVSEAVSGIDRSRDAPTR